MPIRELNSLIDERIGWVDEEMRALLRPHADEPVVYRMMRYHLGWIDAEGAPVSEEEARRFGGKRLRGVLAVLACEACGGDGRAAVPAGAAIELIHNFSLIHDDIEDGDAERRHRPTVWRLWGVPQAINAGSLMQALVHRAALRLGERGVSDRTLIEVTRLLTETVVRMTEGQCMDMLFQDQAGIDTEGYFAMTERKTAALLAAALEGGARAGRASDEHAHLLGHFGREFGLAFQARDDYLGVWGDPKVTGKPVGSDIERGKRSLPVVLLLGQSPDPESVLARLKARDTITVIAEMERLGIRAEVEGVVGRLTAEALGYLEALGEAGAAGQALGLIARAALGREQ